MRLRQHTSIRAAAFFDESGEDYVPQGIGCYALLDLAGRGRLDAVREVFAQACELGRPLLRINAYLDGGQHPGRLRNDDGTPHEPGFVALDRVVDAARGAGVRLILTLANNWNNYGGAEAVVRMAGQGEDKDAFWSNPAVIELQRSHIAAMAGRKNQTSGVYYRDDPTIFAWELCNEARQSRWFARSKTLVTWASAMCGALRDAGIEQPIAWGGSGHRGKHGEDLEALLKDGQIDIATLHLYPYYTEPKLWRIQDRDERIERAIAVGAEVIADRARLCRAYVTPLLVEELGWKLPDKTDDSERAAVMQGLLEEAARQGVGTLPWMIGERGREDYDGLLVSKASHPLTWEVLRCRAQGPSPSHV